MSSVGRIYRTYTGVDPAGPDEENEVPEQPEMDFSDGGEDDESESESESDEEGED